MQGINLAKDGISRRNFVAASTAAVAALGASAALSGCGNNVKTKDEKTETPAEGGEWKMLPCLHGCGTRCMNKVLMKDGVAIRQKTDDTHEDSIEYPQQRGCLRGRSMMDFEMGVDRLKYPMKRVSWSPDDPHGELRGLEGYQRISWDEALDYVAEELRKAYTNYGPKSTMVPTSLSNGRTQYGPLLNALGGYITVSDSISYGTYTANTDMLGIAWGGENYVNDRLDMIQNADVVVLLGQNPAWGAQGNPATFFRAAADNGAQMIVVGPSCNATATMLGARWIPTLPGTDTAFLIGVCGEMLKLDQQTSDIIDWDFLHTYCIGFDEQSMPENAATTENFKGYLQGDYDGVAKDAAWASSICNTPAEDITWFAQQMTKNNNCILSHGYAAARCAGAEDVPQAYMTVACMGGHFGKPGNTCGNYYVDRQGPGNVWICSAGSDGTKDIDTPELEPLYDTKKFDAIDPDDLIPGIELWNAVIEGKYHSIGSCWSGVFNEPVEKDLDIHVIWGGRDGSARSNPNASKMPEAMRKVDFVCMEHFVTTPSAQYADIILPLVSDLELDTISDKTDKDREVLFVYKHLQEPVFEAKSGQWIASEILKRLGYNPEDVYPLSEQQQFFNKIANSEFCDPDGNASPLVTITQDDINAWGVEGTPQEGVVGLEEIVSNGGYQYQRSFGDAYTHIAYKDFIDDPENNPRDSESGKFEIYCQAKADQFNTASMDGETYKPYPTFHDYRPQGDYPMTMFNTHYPRSACSDFNNVATLREVWFAPVTINAADAAAIGITEGDPVKVSSPYGAIVRTATVSHLIVPGAVDVPNGSWQRVGDDGIDYGGNANTLFAGTCHGMGVTGYNNAPVKIEKWNGEALVPDSETQLILDVQE